MRHLLENTTWEIICPVTFRHKGVPRRIDVALTDLRRSSVLPWERVKIVHTDLAAPIDTGTSLRGLRQKDVNYIINAASESHVDRSIDQPRPFVENNVGVMLSMLEWARDCPNLEAFVQVSTDEVYGPAPVGADSAEWDPIVPSNPYSASKAAQEALAVAWWRTYGLPLILTNTMNMVGETQDPEKYMPMVIRRALAGEQITIHAAPDGTVGSRFYLHARNLADAILYLVNVFNDDSAQVHFTSFTEGLRYSAGANRPLRFNVVGEQELDNLQFARIIRDEVVRYAPQIGLSVPDLDEWYTLTNFHESRPGHDLRYALTGDRMRKIGWEPPVPLIESVRKTVRWELDHRADWL